MLVVYTSTFVVQTKKQTNKQTCTMSTVRHLFCQRVGDLWFLQTVPREGLTQVAVSFCGALKWSLFIQIADNITKPLKRNSEARPLMLDRKKNVRLIELSIAWINKCLACAVNPILQVWRDVIEIYICTFLSDSINEALLDNGRRKLLSFHFPSWYTVVYNHSFSLEDIYS